MTWDLNYDLTNTGVKASSLGSIIMHQQRWPCRVQWLITQ